MRMDTPIRRRTRTGILILVLGVAAGSLAAHDLFLKLATYFLPPHTAVRALLLNGTFTTSENSVAQDRFSDRSLVGPAGRAQLDPAAIVPVRDSTWVRFRTAGPGTYVLGLSLRPREIALTGEQFNEYLREEGLEDILADRSRTGTLGLAARERYAKHVKAIFQVGDPRTERYATVLGYPAEIVPLENPYTLGRGDTLRVRVLVNGQPAPGLMVLAGGTDARGEAIRESRQRTDAAGIAPVPLVAAGRWYVKFISMRPAAGTGEGITHESQWATLTFEIRPARSPGPAGGGG
jgi:hypothetical protein